MTRTTSSSPPAPAEAATLSPADAEAAHKARLAAHAARVERELDGKVRQADGRPRSRLSQGRPPKAVISSKGEWFPSVTIAAHYFGKSGPAAILKSIVSGCLCAKRNWRYATQAETGAAQKKRRQRTEAA